MIITRQIDARLDRLKRWMWELHNNLLHARTWTADEITHWRTVVDEIQQGCKEFINKNPFPKLHMLSHTVEFAVANNIWANWVSRKSSPTMQTLTEFMKDTRTYHITPLSACAALMPISHSVQFSLSC